MSWEIDTPSFGDIPAGVGHDASIELVGTYLRLTGRIALGRFARLTDLINALRGYVHVHDAQLLRPDGEPTGLVLPEIMVDQDEISFIAQRATEDPEDGPVTGFVDDAFAEAANRVAREYVMITHGHAVTGTIYLYSEMDVRGFVDATDPRFVSVTDATARSLADQEIVGVYPLLLLNRTQMIAASVIARHDDVVEEGVPDQQTRPDLPRS